MSTGVAAMKAAAEARLASPHDKGVGGRAPCGAADCVRRRTEDPEALALIAEEERLQRCLLLAEGLIRNARSMFKLLCPPREKLSEEDLLRMWLDNVDTFLAETAS